MILKYSKMYENNKYTLKYMSFDWDDNILFMPTVIHMEKEVNGEWVEESVSTSKFAEVRSKEGWRIVNNDPVKAFCEFRDFGPRGDQAFLEDTKKALSSGKRGPSWDQFITALTRGNIFSIITARGHEPETIENAVRYIIHNELTDEQRDEMAASLISYHNLFRDVDPISTDFSFEKLLDEYLDSCDFIGVSSDSFKESAGDDIDASNPEEGKKLAIKRFVEKIHKFGERLDRNVSLGFSDDDKGNVEHIHKLFKDELSLKYVMDYSVFDTSNPDLKGGVHMKIEEMLSSDKVFSYSEYVKENHWFKL